MTKIKLFAVGALMLNMVGLAGCYDVGPGYGYGGGNGGYAASPSYMYAGGYPGFYNTYGPNYGHWNHGYWNHGYFPERGGVWAREDHGPAFGRGGYEVAHNHFDGRALGASHEAFHGAAVHGGESHAVSHASGGSRGSEHSR
jgi:hypothetical protein